LRSAEFGFLGVVVETRVHTPRFCGEPCSAGVAAFFNCFSRSLRTSWLVVGMAAPLSLRGKGDYYKVVRRGPKIGTLLVTARNRSGLF
jgi:hypothetical protein